MVTWGALGYRLIVAWSLNFAAYCSARDIIEAVRPGLMRQSTPDLLTCGGMALCQSMIVVAGHGMLTNWRR